MASKDINKPNIVVIMSDDQGAWTLGCAGNSEIKTPNIDRLAQTGIRYSNFFCASPVCSPARASFLTGRIPSQHGVHDWIRSGNIDYKKLPKDIQKEKVFQSESEPIEYLKGMTAYTEILSSNGYNCGLSGKWHLGYSLKPQKGFSHWFTIARGGCEYFRPDLVKGSKVYFGDSYITDIITEDALRYLDEQQNDTDPFYVSVHYTAPHSPWDSSNHPKKYLDMYENCPFESCPNEPVNKCQILSAPVGWTQKDRHEILRGYYAAITAMDYNIGLIIDKIEEMGLRENTIIVFTSDNGMNMGHHGIWGKGNGTFPQNMFDTAVKVPFIISRPTHIEEGSVCDELLSHYDFMPTLLDYLGMENPEEDKLPGESFAPLLRGEDISARKNVVIFDEYGPVRMIRNKEWKYIHRYPYGPNELYDLKNDPNEKNNLIEDPSKEHIIETMKAELQDWFINYVNPEIDGSKEAVVGTGQFTLAGIGAKGKKTYLQEIPFVAKDKVR